MARRFKQRRYSKPLKKDKLIVPKNKTVCEPAGKVIYDNEELAIKSMTGLIFRGEHKVHTYICQFADHWHVGHYDTYAQQFDPSRIIRKEN